MKTYAIEIESCHSPDEKMYMSKGHHSVEDFVKELIEYGVDPEDYSVPKHYWVKTTPAPKNSWYTCLYHFVEQGTRGAYPATYVHEYGEVMYKDYIKEKQND